MGARPNPLVVRKQGPLRRLWAQIRRSLRWLDYVILVFSMLVFVGVSLAAWHGSGNGALVSIKAGDTEYVYKLDKDQDLIIPGPLGPSKIEIRNGAVHFLDSPCRDKLCVHSGWLKTKGQWAACMPNRIFIRIDSNDEASLDATAY